MMHDEEWREAKEDYDLGLADHHVMMEEARIEHERRQDQEDCPHYSVVTYTMRDWRETGIAPGTVCEDCGAEFDIEELDTRSFERDPDTGRVTW